MKTRFIVSVMGLVISMGTLAVRGDLRATPGSFTAGSDFAALNATVQSSGISTSFVDAEGTTVRFYNPEFWLNGDRWNGLSAIISVEPDRFGWYTAITFDFGRPVTISEVAAFWMRENPDNYAVPNISYIADNINNAPFATTVGHMPHETDPWPGYLITTDTGALTQPVTLTKLIIKMTGFDPVYSRPVEPMEFDIYGYCGTIQGTYEYSWYDNLESRDTPWGVYGTASNTLISYNYGSCDAGDPAQVARVQTFLDNSLSRCNTQVILSCKELLLFVQDGSKTWTDFTNYIQAFNSHPALKGWYLADEPYGKVSQTICEQGYAKIRENSTKPVYMCFHSTDLNHNVPYNYRNAYDIMMFDSYPFSIGDGEYASLEGTGGWKALCQNAMAQADLAGKPYINVLQAFGKMKDDGWLNWGRFPTYAEERFMCLWSVLKGSDGLSFWSIDIADLCAASPAEVYPFDGNAWLADVGLPVCQELSQLKYALKSGLVDNGVTDNSSNVMSSVYMDPQTNEYHLIAVNSSAGSAAVTYTLNLPVQMRSAEPQWGAAGQTTKTVSGNSLTDTLSGYEVHHYILSSVGQAIPGDANNDGKVDVSDLGILAANYGMTAGATWALGDFNGDTRVDVSDLGILAANYGTGAGSALDFDKDAQAFGLTPDAKEEAPATLSSGCAAAGLPLLAGLFLMGILFVKLDE